MTAGEGFWDFSLRVYGAPGVADWCLRLQDQHGADVNLLLWCAWVGSLGILLGTQDLVAAEAATSAWREAVVGPLRSARQALRGGDLGAVSAEMAVALRTRVKAVELEAERLQQTVLGRLLEERSIARANPSTPAKQAVAANLAVYLEHLEVPPGEISAALERAALAAR
jgi:uncharacterized protein (TIGR02444 family)